MNRQQETTETWVISSSADFCHLVISFHFSGGHVNKEPQILLFEWTSAAFPLFLKLMLYHLKKIF